MKDELKEKRIQNAIMAVDKFLEDALQEGDTETWEFTWNALMVMTSMHAYWRHKETNPELGEQVH